MEPTTTAKRTAGEWRQVNECHVFCGRDQNIRMLAEGLANRNGICYTAETVANIRTIVIAGTAANAVDAMGLDGDAAIEALPEILAERNELVAALTLARLELHLTRDALITCVSEQDRRIRENIRKTLEKVDAVNKAIESRAILARLRPAT